MPFQMIYIKWVVSRQGVKGHLLKFTNGCYSKTAFFFPVNFWLLHVQSLVYVVYKLGSGVSMGSGDMETTICPGTVSIYSAKAV